MYPVGVYDGFDYLPAMFDSWVLDPCRVMFCAIYEDRVVGLDTVTLLDSGKTVMFQVPVFAACLVTWLALSVINRHCELGNNGKGWGLPKPLHFIMSNLSRKI